MISIVIPTLQKSISTLELLLKTLNNDEAVGEIIVIDNSLKGLDIKLDKLRVITPKENLYVNPSWNLGVKEAKFEKVGLLNDDIAIPEDFCTQVEKFISENIGIVGIGEKTVLRKEEINFLPTSKTLNIIPADERNFNFGTAMFFHKNSYFMIPEDIKIFYGDDWIFVKNTKSKKENFIITNCELFHLESLSSGDKTFNPILLSDKKFYKKNMFTWYEYLFSFEKTKKRYAIKYS